MVAKWWQREEVTRTILLMSGGTIWTRTSLTNAGLSRRDGRYGSSRSREAKSWKVTQRIMTGAEVLD
jgi:hypothetical protein